MRDFRSFAAGDEEEILAKYLLIYRVGFYGFSMLGFFLVIALLFLVPVKDGELPVRARYPFDTTKQPGHGVGYFVEICSVSVGMTAIIGMDTLFANLCNLFLVQLEILNVHFRKCGDRHDASTVGDLGGDPDHAILFRVKIARGKDNCDPGAIHGDRSDGAFAKRLRRSIRGYQRLLALVRDFNEVFSASMFAQVLSSTSMICLTGFQATTVSRDKSKCRSQIVMEDRFVSNRS